MQATARRLSVVSATSCARRRLIRDVLQTNRRSPRLTNSKETLGRSHRLSIQHWELRCQNSTQMPFRTALVFGLGFRHSQGGTGAGSMPLEDGGQGRRMIRAMRGASSHHARRLKPGHQRGWGRWRGHEREDDHWSGALAFISRRKAIPSERAGNAGKIFFAKAKATVCFHPLASTRGQAAASLRSQQACAPIFRVLRSPPSGHGKRPSSLKRTAFDPGG